VLGLYVIQSASPYIFKVKSVCLNSYKIVFTFEKLNKTTQIIDRRFTACNNYTIGIKTTYSTYISLNLNSQLPLCSSSSAERLTGSIIYQAGGKVFIKIWKASSQKKASPSSLGNSEVRNLLEELNFLIFGIFPYFFSIFLFFSFPKKTKAICFFGNNFQTIHPRQRCR